MRESNSRDWSHNPVPKPFGQSRHRKSGAGRVNRTLVGEVQALCTPTVLDQQTLWSWRGDSNAAHGLTRPALFLLSYQRTTSFRTLEAVGRIALPMICFAGRCLAVLATPPLTDLLNLERKAGLEPALSFLACPEQLRRAKLPNGLATSRLGHSTTSAQIMERAARVELPSSGWRPEAPAAIPCSRLAGDEGFEPS
jgi:hypothetical protein